MVAAAAIDGQLTEMTNSGLRDPSRVPDRLTAEPARPEFELRPPEPTGTAFQEAAHALGSVGTVQNRWQGRAKMLYRGTLGGRTRDTCVGKRCPHSEWSLLRDYPSDRDGPAKLCTGRNDFLHEANPECFVGAKLVRSEQIAHRVSPAKLGRGSERGASEGHDPTRYLQLPEANVIRGDDDIRSQCKLDGQREGDPLYGDHDRLRNLRAPDSKGIKAPRACKDLRPTLRGRRSDIGEVEPGREVITVAKQNTHAKLRLGAQEIICRRELLDGRKVERVSLLRPIDA
jgi:hypothetical protein